MGSHSYLQNLNSCAGLPASVRVHMQCSDTLMELGDTYVKNAQLQGRTNFLNQYGHGNTQVDNLSGLRGSVQTFGLQELLLGANGHGIWQHDPAVGKVGGFALSIKPAKNASYSELDGIHVARALLRFTKVVKSIAIAAKKTELNIRPRNVADGSRNVAIP